MKTRPKEIIYEVAAFNMQSIHNHGSPTLYRMQEDSYSTSACSTVWKLWRTAAPPMWYW